MENMISVANIPNQNMRSAADIQARNQQQKSELAEIATQLEKAEQCQSSGHTSPLEMLIDRQQELSAELSVLAWMLENDAEAQLPKKEESAPAQQSRYAWEIYVTTHQLLHTSVLIESEELLTRAYLKEKAADLALSKDEDQWEHDDIDTSIDIDEILSLRA